MLQTKEEIEIWLKIMNVGHYRINDDLTVDVWGHIYLIDKKLTEIPIQFNIVYGDFNCSVNNLTSLKGCPRIVHGDFYCGSNCLKSLEYFPEIFHGWVYCCNNKLKSLKYIPKEIEGIDCRSNKKLNSLDCLNIVHGEILCDYKLEKSKYYKIHLMLKALRK